MEYLNQQLTLPKSVLLLEEVNLPADLARSLAGQSVVVKILAEESYAFRERPDRKDYLLARGDGDYWNAYQPTRVLFKDADGRSWCLPRSWLGTAHWESQVDWSCSDIEGTATLIEGVNLPSFWDLLEINIPAPEALEAARRRTSVEVRFGPRKLIRVIWRDSEGRPWRIPPDWRRRRVKLPTYDQLVSQGIPDDVAKDFAEKVVSVNYHPGSLCCLPEQYRFRDQDGNRWPVCIRDCIAFGYGDAEEHPA
jgi:hypothetical protein